MLFAKVIYTEIYLAFIMPKWKEGAKEFTVGVNYSEVHGYQATIPKPVMARLSNPEKLTFLLKREKVEVRAGPSH
ncbi:MAG: hypothetical protein ACLP8Y_04175 [Thermoplasmata archaeon]